MFLDYGGDKRFVVKGYVDASCGTGPDDFKSFFLREDDFKS